MVKEQRSLVTVTNTLEAINLEGHMDKVKYHVFNQNNNKASIEIFDFFQ